MSLPNLKQDKNVSSKRAVEHSFEALSQSIGSDDDSPS